MSEKQTHTHTKEGLHQRRSIAIHAGGFIWSRTTALALIPEMSTLPRTHMHSHSTRTFQTLLCACPGCMCGGV